MNKPIDDDSMGDVWRDVKEARAEKRANNREQSAQILRDAGVEFEAKNLGAHLIVRAECGVFDFWPGTGLWQRRGDPKQSRGVHSLMRKISAAKVADPKDTEIARLSAALSEALAQLEAERARNAAKPMTRDDVERQYVDGIHIGSGLPRATCPCGLCKKYPEAAGDCQK